MAESRMEDIVLCIDDTSSMLMKDYPPNRLVALKKVVVSFAKERQRIDARDRIAIVGFSGKVICKLTNKLDVLSTSLKSLKAKKTSEIGKGLAIAVQLLIKEIQQTSSKNYRIILITGGRSWGTDSDPFEIIKLAGELNIPIDVIRIREQEVADFEEVLEKMSEETKGMLLNPRNKTDLLATMNELNCKKDLGCDDFEYSCKDPESDKNMLNSIAGDLLIPGEEGEFESLLKEKKGQKCIICKKDLCTSCGHPFIDCGGFCCSCSSPMHLHCSRNWAKNSPPKDNWEIFRCPSCHFLLKVPETLDRGLQGVRLFFTDKEKL